MDSTKPHTVILGGGVCGLYAARTLTQAGYPVTLLERAAQPGGLATSFKHGNNFYDLGVHMLHAHDKTLFEDLKPILGDDRIEVDLDARIRWAGSFYRYPLQFGDMIRGIPPWTLAWYVTGLFWSELYYRLFPRDPKDAREALIQLYGKPLYRFFFEEFTERYWGIHPKHLSATFIKSKMPRLSAVDVLKKAFSWIGLSEKKGNSTQSALSEETLHYSQTGAEMLPRKLADSITKTGGTITLNATVTELTLTDQQITKIHWTDSKGLTHNVQPDHVISTLPLPLLVQSITPSLNPNLLDAAKHLRFKPIVIYGLLIKKERVLDALYIYYRSHIFHRLGEPKNAGLQVTPDDHTVLIVEMTCDENDPKWNGDPEVIAQIHADLERENICSPEDIVETHKLRYPTGYPIFDLGFESHHQKIQDWLDTIPNLQSTGRQGGFCYPNMHSAMRMGANAAETIIHETPKSL